MLDVSKVSRSLDRKTLIFWLEVTDIFLVMMFCSILNFVFGGTGMKLYFVYFPTLLLAATLIIVKRGKPEKFLIHFLKYQFQTKYLRCFDQGSDHHAFLKAIAVHRKAK